MLADRLFKHRSGCFVVDGGNSIRAYRTEYQARLYLSEVQGRLADAKSASTSSANTGSVVAWKNVAVFVGAASGLFIIIWVGQLASDRRDRAVYENTSTVQSVPFKPTNADQSNARPQQLQPSTVERSIPQSHSVPSLVDAHPERYKDPSYIPNEADYDLVAKYTAGGNRQREKDMKEGLCAFYGNC